MITVLFTSSGRRAELLNCFREDAADLGIPLRVLAADLNPEFSAACHHADLGLAVPPCGDQSYVQRLREICRTQKVDLLVPTIDPELRALAEARDEFEAEGTKVQVSSPDVVAMARNKKATAVFLAAAGIPGPRTGGVEEILRAPESWRWPMILKPIGGSSSIGAHVAADLDEFKRHCGSRDDFLAQEFWKGREFTVNLFFDRSGTMRCAIPHWRKETRSGEVSKGITVREPKMMELAGRLGAALTGARGALCFQAILTDAGEAAIFEINARFGGGYPLAHRAGGRFSKWLLEEAAGRECSAGNEWRDRLMMLRYDAAVFVAAPEEA